MSSLGVVALATLGKLLESVGTDRFQQSPAGAALGPGEYDQRLRDKVGDTIRHGCRIETTCRHDSGSGINGESAGEDAQAPQQLPLRVRQQLMAPIERRV